MVTKSTSLQHLTIEPATDVEKSENEYDEFTSANGSGLIERLPKIIRGLIKTVKAILDSLDKNSMETLVVFKQTEENIKNGN